MTAAETMKRNVVFSLTNVAPGNGQRAESTPRADEFRRAATILKSLSDTGRLKTCWLLSRRGPMNVGALAKACGVSSSAMSHQLRVLRNLGMVDFHREGKSAVYELKSEQAQQLIEHAMIGANGRH